MYNLTLVTAAFTSLAVLFAFLSWRASSMDDKYERERSLRNEYRDLYYPVTESHQLNPIRFRVLEKRGRKYRFYRYFLFSRFEGTTKVLFDCTPNLLDEDVIEKLNARSCFSNLGILDKRVNQDNGKIELEFNTADIEKLSERLEDLTSAFEKYLNPR